MKVQEIIEVKILSLDVEIIHEGVKRISDMRKESRDEIVEWIKSEIKLGEEYGFIPYGNFEYSIEFRLV